MAFGNLLVRNPLPLILHMRSEVEFLRRALPPYSAMEYINTVTVPGDWILADKLDWLRYYVRAPMVSLAESKRLQRLTSRKDDRTLASSLARSGYRYLVFDRAQSNSSWPFMTARFLESYATLEFSTGSVEVYRLHENDRTSR